MRINNITLENFRSYKEPISIVGLSNVNVFIGANNAGKSNILEAFRYMQAMARGKQQKSFEEIVFDGDSKRNIHIRLSVSLSEQARNKFIKKLFQENPSIRVHKIIKSSFLSNLILDVVIGNRGLVQEEIMINNIISGHLSIVKNTIKNKLWSHELPNLAKECENTNFVNLKASFGSKGSRSPAPDWSILNIPGMHPAPIEHQIVSRLRENIEKWRWLEPIRRAQPNMPLGEQAQLDSRGSSLVKFLFTIQNNNPEENRRIKDKFHEILPEIQKVTARLRGGEAIVTIDEKGLTSARDFSNISSGLAESLILISGIENTKPDAVVLMEEPELHLHAGSQRKLFEIIKREAEKKQFFVTTHSSVFTCCSDKVSTYLVTKKEGITSVSKIEETSGLKRIKNELGHRNTDLYGYEIVVFIEGDSEEVAFRIIAEALGYDLVENGIHLTNIRGKGRVSKISEYLQYLKNSDVSVYVIADGDNYVKRKLEDWVREGLLQKDCYTVWDKEFEDCFELDIVLNAMKKMAKEQGFKFDITLENLKENMTTGKSVVRALGKLLHEKDLPSLDKPTLAENIALLLKEKIEKTPLGERKKTPPEQVIEKIVKIVEAR